MRFKRKKRNKGGRTSRIEGGPTAFAVYGVSFRNLLSPPGVAGPGGISVEKVRTKRTKSPRLPSARFFLRVIAHKLLQTTGAEATAEVNFSWHFLD